MEEKPKTKSKQILRMCLTIIIYWCLTFFLLSVLPGAASLPVAGQKGGSITLPCFLSNREDLDDLTNVLSFGPITAYGARQDEHFRDRVHKSGHCDLILQDLKTTDAGKYMSKVFANGQLLNSYTYDIHVNVNLTGLKDEELMFDHLPREAKSVERFTNVGRKEVWRREQGVLTDRLTDKHDRLTIENFTSGDAGIYSVLNSSGGLLVTLTVTESESKGKQDSTHEDETHDTKRVHVWILILILIGVLVVLIGFAVIMKLQRRHQNRNNIPTKRSQCKQLQGP